MIELLKRLVSISSVSGDEDEILRFIYDYTEEKQVDRIQGDGYIAAIKKSPKIDVTKALILHGHVDTVSYEPKLWSTDPLLLTKNDGALHGLGSTDMKAGVAIMLELLSKKKNFHYDTIFLFCGGEEVDGRGVREFIDKNKDLLARYNHIEAITLEPTRASSFSRSHRGNHAFVVEFSGEGGHGSRPYEIKNSVTESTLILSEAIFKIRKKWAKLYADKILGSPNISITAISSGDKAVPNQIPSRSKIYLDVRTTPKLEPVLINELHNALEKCSSNFTITPTILASSALHTGASKIANELLSLGIEEFTFTGATDLSFLQERSIKGIIYGPGEPDAMHIANEYVEIKAINRCLEVIENIMEKY